MFLILKYSFLNSQLVKSNQDDPIYSQTSLLVTQNCTIIKTICSVSVHASYLKKNYNGHPMFISYARYIFDL